MPYSWGGFSSIEEFKEGLANGRYAGNVPRSSREGATGRAVGLDCSGFVARCWDLPTKQSTRTLGAICYVLADYDELLPGDILNIVNGHVVLFKEWVDEEHTRMRVYEADRLFCKENEYATAARKQRGFVPMRYKPLDSRWVAMDFANVAFTNESEMKGRFVSDPAGIYPELSTLKSPLANATALEWAGYSLKDDFLRLPGSYERTLMVARVDETRIDTQTVSEISGKQVMTGGGLARKESIPEALLEFMAFEEPLTDLMVIASSAEKGEYELGDRRFPAHLVSAYFETSWNMHGVIRPVMVEVECVLSDEVPVFGILEARFMQEIVWAEDEDGESITQQRELIFILHGYGE